MCLTGTPFADRYKNRFCIQKSFRISAERVLGIPFAAGKRLLLSVRHFYENRFSLKFTIRSKKKRKAGFILLSVFSLFVQLVCTAATAVDRKKVTYLTGMPFANRYKNRFCIQKSFRISAERVLGIPFAAGKRLLLSVRHFYENRFSLKFTIRSKKKRKASFILLSVFLLSC